MSMLTLGTLWQSTKRWKTFFKIMLVIGCILLIDTLYRHYTHGQITVDESLLKRLEQIRIEEIADKLLAAGFEEELNDWHYYSGMNYHNGYAYIHPAIRSGDSKTVRPEIDVIRFAYQPVDPVEEPDGVKGRYRRSGLYEWFYNLKPFGYCHAELTVQTSQVSIYIYDFDSDGNWSRFEEALEWILGCLEDGA